MGWNLRFWRRARTAPGVNLNWSWSGPSVSVGPRGAKVSVGRMGIRRTVGIPGTGLFATDQASLRSLRDTDRPRPASDRGAAPAAGDVERCGLCGRPVGTDGRCVMRDQPVEQWRDA
jgi:hypothetical protein